MPVSRPAIFLDGLSEREPPPGRLEIDDLIARGNFQRSQDLSRDRRKQLLRQGHEILVSRIGLIELKHGEFRIMAHRDPLVAKIAIELKDSLYASDQETL